MKEKGLGRVKQPKDILGRYENCQHINQFIEKHSDSNIYQVCYACKQQLYIRKES